MAVALFEEQNTQKLLVRGCIAIGSLPCLVSTPGKISLKSKNLHSPHGRIRVLIRLQKLGLFGP